jgi:hypothetical protein
MNGMFDFLQDVGNHADRCVGRNAICGLVVDTSYTSDCGYETAILDNNGCHPVERYKTKEDAFNGHIKWCNEATLLDKITKLGWLDWMPLDEEIVTLQRFDENDEWYKKNKLESIIN